MAKNLGKKGNAVIDGGTIIVILFVMAIVTLFTYLAFDEFNTDIQADTDLDSKAQNISGDLYTKFPSLFDNLFLFAFVLFVIFVIVSVFVLDTHPIFFIISVVLVIAIFIAGALLANAYDDIASDSIVSSYANQFTYTAWIMQHLVQLIVAIVFVVLVALFAKMRAG